MPHCLTALSVACLFCAGVLGKEAASGFSGTWDIDKNQSTASSGIPDGLEQQIKHKKSEMVIKSNGWSRRTVSRPSSFWA